MHKGVQEFTIIDDNDSADDEDGTLSSARDAFHLGRYNEVTIFSDIFKLC